MSDSFSPDVGQQIAPDGSILYDFVGRISALGLDLLGTTLQWFTNSAGPPDRVAGDRLAQLLANTLPSGEMLLIARAFGDHANVIQASRTIVSSAGASSFLTKAGAITAQQVNYGSQAFVWDGTDEMFVDVAHGLPGQPVVMFACSNNNNSLAVYRCYSPDAVSFTVDVINVDVTTLPAGVNDSFQWIAIG